MTTTAPDVDPGNIHRSPLRGRWIDRWDPEDAGFWASTGSTIARRNLWFSILSEHIGFSIWSLWSVLVLFMGADYCFSAADKFFLVGIPTLVGAFLRLPTRSRWPGSAAATGRSSRRCCCWSRRSSRRSSCTRAPR